MNRRPLVRSAVALLGLFSLVACNRPTEDLPEWTPRDHDHASKPNEAQVDTRAPRPGMPALEKFGINEVTLAAWKQNCVPCHGLIGRGDGPQGAALRPTDLTNPKWQKVALDDEIARTIKKGRGRMPGFPALPDDTVDGLVRLVRLMNAERPAPSDAPPNGATPAAPEKAPEAPPSAP